VIGYRKDRDWKNKLMPPYSSGETDVAIVCTHMMLAAWEEGIGSCWVGYFNSDSVSEALGLDENVRVTAMLPIGYPADDAEPLKLHYEIRPYEDTVFEI
jgi:nitroreductase